jgi:hypothetical protein
MSTRNPPHPVNHIKRRTLFKTATTTRTTSLIITFTFTFFLVILFLFRHDQFRSNPSMTSNTSSSSSSSSNHISLQDFTPLTTLIGSSKPGYHLFQNLYIHEGSYLAITDKPDSFPDSDEIVRKVGNGGKTRWKVIGREEVDELGDVVGVWDGVTVSGERRGARGQCGGIRVVKDEKYSLIISSWLLCDPTILML